MTEYVNDWIRWEDTPRPTDDKLAHFGISFIVAAFLNTLGLEPWRQVAVTGALAILLEYAQLIGYLAYRQLERLNGSADKVIPFQGTQTCSEYLIVPGRSHTDYIFKLSPGDRIPKWLHFLTLTTGIDRISPWDVAYSVCGAWFFTWWNTL